MNGNGVGNTARPLTIALLDDEPGVLLALKLLLQTFGHRVRDFSAPLTAIEALRADPGCDLMICDLRMPQMDGLQVLQAWRTICPGAPFILMSGHANSEEVEKAREMGAAGFLGKPFTPEDLKRILSI